jgi:hypothetical protein
MSDTIYDIGNYVLSTLTKKPTKLDAWGLKTIIDGNQQNSYHPEIKVFEPILISEYWHNKFGVYKNGFGNFEYKLPRKQNINCTLIFTSDYIMLHQLDVGDKPINAHLIAIWNKDVTRREIYVHEWQNLYLLLSGEKLKIKRKTNLKSKQP